YPVPDFYAYHDNPIANVDYASLAMFRLGSFKNTNIYVHVTDPGVGFREDHDRSILITQNYGLYIGPNNGSLGNIASFLDAAHEKYELYKIDFDKLTKLERFRLGKGFEGYIVPQIIHGRDAFGTIAGYIAGGITPDSFADKKSGTMPVRKTGFGQQPIHLENLEQGPIKGYAIQDRTFGNIILNITTSHEYAKTLSDRNAKLKISRTDAAGEGNSVIVQAKHFFSQVKEGDYLSYPGSPTWILPPKDGKPFEQRAFLGAAKNYQGNVKLNGGIAGKLGINLVGAAPVELSLVQ
ncbi:MAG: SAM-dependent chlorinase/fluorinase, partial [Vampirovibrio sp.]|nr:SAM-dependent chlorinase/fluorinase [Vampirovibrio sp.]